MSWHAKAKAEKICIEYGFKMSRRVVLDKMAGRASKSGEGIWCSVKTLTRETGASESTIHRVIREFLGLGVLEYGDPELVAHIPADKRPRVYNLVFDAQKRLQLMLKKVCRLLPRKKPQDRLKKGERGVTVTPKNPSAGCHNDGQTVKDLKINQAQPPAAAPAAPEDAAAGAAFRALIRARRLAKAA